MCWLHGRILAEEEGVLGVLAGPVVSFQLDLALADLVGLPNLELLLPVEGQLPETTTRNSGPVFVDEVDGQHLGLFALFADEFLVVDVGDLDDQAPVVELQVQIIYLLVL